MKILLCSELGGGSGHRRCLQTLVAALSQQEHECVLAASSAHVVENCTTVRVPSISPMQVDPSFQARSFADVLGVAGFSEEGPLLKRTTMWRDVVDQHNPGLIISDFAPFACFAAKGLAPTLSVGSGFSTPPKHLSSFPTLNPAVESTFGETQILSNLSRIAEKLGFERLIDGSSLPACVAADENIVRCYREFDPYASDRLVSACGPIESPKRIERPAMSDWPARFYAYLWPHAPAIEAIIDGLCKTMVPGDVFLASADRRLLKSLERPHLNVLSRRAEWNDILPAVSLVIHHGGIGSAQACASAGVPQLVVPMHLEHELTARSVLNLGIGAALVPTYDGVDIAQAIERLMGVDAYRSNAIRYARHVDDYQSEEFVRRVIRTIENVD